MGVVIARNGFDVVVHCRREEVAASINAKNRNPNYLTEYTLPKNLTATTSAAECLKDVSFVVHAVPIQSTFAYLDSIKEHIPLDAVVVSTSKGLQSDSLAMMYELIPAALGRKQTTAFVSGPSFVSRVGCQEHWRFMYCRPKSSFKASPQVLLLRQRTLKLRKVGNSVILTSSAVLDA